MKLALLFLVLLLALGGIWVFLKGPLRNPTDAMNDFLEGRGRFEDQLTDPLVLAGPRVQPLVLSAVADREMEYRRYGLAYLGCSHYGPAGKLLHQILSDDTEKDYFRAEALEALWRLDHHEGLELAEMFHTRQDFLGETASRLLESGQLWTECRTWLSALTGRHN